MIKLRKVRVFMSPKLINNCELPEKVKFTFEDLNSKWDIIEFVPSLFNYNIYFDTS